MSTVLSRAEQLLQGRRDAIGGLERAAARLDETRAAVAAAEKEMAEAISNAKSAGWTTNELRQLGLPIATTQRSKGSTKRTGGRGRGRNAASPATHVVEPAAAHLGEQHAPSA